MRLDEIKKAYARLPLRRLGDALIYAADRHAELLREGWYREGDFIVMIDPCYAAAHGLPTYNTPAPPHFDPMTFKADIMTSTMKLSPQSAWYGEVELSEDDDGD